MRVTPTRHPRRPAPRPHNDPEPAMVTREPQELPDLAGFGEVPDAGEAGDAEADAGEACGCDRCRFGDPVRSSRFGHRWVVEERGAECDDQDCIAANCDGQGGGELERDHQHHPDPERQRRPPRPRATGSGPEDGAAGEQQPDRAAAMVPMPKSDIATIALASSVEAS